MAYCNRDGVVYKRHEYNSEGVCTKCQLFKIKQEDILQYADPDCLKTTAVEPILT